MKRGQEIADKLATLIVEKMEKRAHHGDWSKLSLYDCPNYIKAEIQELECELEWAPTKGNEELWKSKIRYEIADVAAYCAIMLDVLEKE